MSRRDRSGPTAAQRALIERFLAAYDKIEGRLRSGLKQPESTPFTELITRYGERNTPWLNQDGETLHRYAPLRDALLHQKTTAEGYVAVPVLAAVQEIERVWAALLKPAVVYPKFKRTVVTLRTADPLSKALAATDARGYSQFPVYERGRFAGLLTENGIARWLAEHAVQEGTRVTLKDASVGDVLRKEEKRKNVAFVPRDAVLAEVITEFGRRPLLEAVLITEDGEEREKPLGIMTRWDVAEAVG